MYSQCFADAQFNIRPCKCSCKCFDRNRDKQKEWWEKWEYIYFYGYGNHDWTVPFQKRISIAHLFYDWFLFRRFEFEWWTIDGTMWIEKTYYTQQRWDISICDGTHYSYIGLSITIQPIRKPIEKKKTTTKNSLILLSSRLPSSHLDTDHAFLCTCLAMCNLKFAQNFDTLNFVCTHCVRHNN